MIRPKPEDLLHRIAAALDETVLPAVTDGPARRQLQAATAALRRIAYALPRQAGVVAEDTADLEKTLRAATALLGQDAQTLDAALADEDRNLALQEAVADLQTQLPTMKIADSLRGQLTRMLDDYYRRTVERDLSLNPPGKDKTDG